MSEAEKTKPNQKESTSTATTTSAVPTPTSSAVTTTSKVSSSTTATTSSTSITSSSSTATSPSSSSTNTASSGSGSSNASSNVSSTSASSSSSTKTPTKPPPLPPPGAAPPTNQYELTEPAIRKAFVDFMKDPECLDKAADYLYESLLEDAVMGVYLEVHHAVKTGAWDAIEGQPEDDTAYKIVDTPNFDVFGMSTTRKAMNCTCPNCDRPVSAAKFAPHLEKCMGMGRKTSRTASRRLANAKEGNSSYFSSNVSDDEDDADWSSEKRRKKIQNSRTNGSKKNDKAS